MVKVVGDENLPIVGRFLLLFPAEVHERTASALLEREAIVPTGAVFALGAIADGSDFAVGTGEMALVVKGEIQGAEAVALASGADHSCDQLGAAVGYALDLGEEFGVAGSLVIDEFGRKGPQVFLLLVKQGDDAAAVGRGPGGGRNLMDEVVGGGDADVEGQVASFAVVAEGGLRVDGGADDVGAFEMFVTQGGI